MTLKGAKAVKIKIVESERFKNEVGTKVFWLAAIKVNGKTRLVSNIKGGNWHTNPKWTEMFRKYGNKDGSFSIIRKSKPEDVNFADFCTINYFSPTGGVKLPKWY